MWIKTCRTTEGSRLLVCDECYEENASILVIVPGDRVVMARCDHCWRYGNPRDFVEIAQAGARTPTRGRALSARRKKGASDGFGGASPAAWLQAGQERPGRVDAAPVRGLGGGVLQRTKDNEGGHRAGGLGGPRGQ
jgi:hypothetical protein